ncbi:hypothetical protein FIBSPDRAFT_926536 [Athelia psychrophila]|uniref:Uncharacterized protein n=1 Tax=Athelia psychrophila TaxID=1759441 RepID=A0A166TAG6_9AGAM|nr:hypothetical protein FIBSPDRAFT_926536 [Fibularhizoctonia sp. CBS 109695]
MCYTAYQKYKDCRVFRTHYVYRDIQCEELKMWTKLFKKEVWCRAIYQDGTKPFVDDDQQTAVRSGKHYPTPPLEVEVPARLVCRRCNGQTKAARAARKPRRAQRADEKRADGEKPKGMRAMIKRQTLTIRHIWSENMPRTYDVLTHVVPQAFAYNLLRIAAKAKAWTH